MRKQPLNERHARFIEGVASGESARQAARNAGYRSTSMSTKLLEDERVRTALKRSAMAAGLDVTAIGERLRALADAQRYELSRDGSPVHLGPDNRAQLQALDIVIRMLGGYPNPRAEQHVSGQQVLIINGAVSPLAAMDPFAPAIEERHDPDAGIPLEDDYLIG